MSSQSQSGDKRWMGKSNDVYAVFREQLFSWALGKGRRYSQVLQGCGRIGRLRYRPDMDVSSSDDEEIDLNSQSDILPKTENGADTVKPDPDKSKDNKLTLGKSMDADSTIRNLSVLPKTKGTKRQRLYNKISAELYSKITSSLGPGPMKIIITRRVTTGDAFGAMNALDDNYLKANPTELHSLFQDLVSINMGIYTDFDEYLFKFNQTVTSIDVNPGMVEHLKKGKHALPNQLLVAVFLQGLSDHYSTVREIIRTTKNNADLADVMDDVSAYHSASKKTDGSQTYGAFGGNPSSQTPTHTPGRTKKPCFNWAKKGKCRFGSKCRYSHDVKGNSNGPDQSAHTRQVNPNSFGVSGQNHQDCITGLNTNFAGSCKISTTFGANPTNNDGKLSPRPERKQCYYAVHNGFRGYSGVLERWDQTVSKVKDAQGAWRSGVQCRKFDSQEEAESYLFYLSNKPKQPTNGESYGVWVERDAVSYGAYNKHTPVQTKEILDSGTNVHTRGNMNGLANTSVCQEHLKVADGKTINISHRGDVGILRNARVVPGGPNLTSIGQLCDDYQREFILSSSGMYIFCPETGERTEIGIRNASTNFLYQALPGMLGLNSPIIKKNPATVIRNNSKSKCSTAMALEGSESNLKSSMEYKARLMHDRLGHLCYDKLAEAVEQGLIKSDVKPDYLRRLSKNPPLCRGCGLGKSYSRPYRRNHKEVNGTPAKASKPFQRLCIDTCIVNAKGGGTYNCFIIIIDEYSRYIWALPLRHRRSAPSRIKVFIDDLRKQGHKDTIDIIRSDGAKEFVFSLDRHIDQGTTQEFGAPHSSVKTNAVAERGIRTICQMARCTMLQANAPERVWTYCLQHCVNVYNNMPHANLPQGKSPAMALRPGRVSTCNKHVRTFFCPVFVKSHTLDRSRKFSAMAELGRYLGYDPQQLGYLVLIKGRVFTRRDVYFYEDIQRAEKDLLHCHPGDCSPSPFDLHKYLPDPGTEIKRADGQRPTWVETDDELYIDVEAMEHPRNNNSDHKTLHDNVRPIVISTDDEIYIQEESNLSDDDVTPSEIDSVHEDLDMEGIPCLEDPEDAKSSNEFNGRPKRTRAPRVPINMGGSQHDLWSSSSNTASIHDQPGSNEAGNITSPACRQLYTPKTYADAISCADGQAWHDAIQAEYKNFEIHDVWEAVPKPKNLHNLIKPLLVFRNKYHPNGRLKKRKARLCARGDTQMYGVDFKDTFAPTVRASSLKTFLSLCTRQALKVIQFDVPAAYLQSILEDQYQLFMSPPPGYQIPHDYVLRLKKAVYGCRQSGRCFFQQFTEFIRSIGFTQCILDPCLFYRNRTNGDKDLLAIHVDDGILGFGSASVETEIMSAMQKRWGVEEYERINHYLGFQFNQNDKNSRITMKSTSYIEDLLEKYNMTEANPKHTPMECGLILDNNPQPDEVISSERYPYRQLIGSLQYLSVNSRPDISFAVGRLSRGMNSPTMKHWNCAKRVLAYLSHTKNLAIVFEQKESSEEPIDVVVTCDSDFASDPSRRSTYGYFTRIGENIINWKSRLDKSKISLSTCEAELKAIVEGAKDAIYHHNLINEVGIPVKRKYTVQSDNKPALKLCQNSQYHGRAKHIDISQHFVRLAYDEGKVELQHVPTQDNIADLLTKALPRDKHEHLTKKILVSAE